jgi:hypothetical protein
MLIDKDDADFSRQRAPRSGARGCVPNAAARSCVAAVEARVTEVHTLRELSLLVITVGRRIDR